MQKQIFPILFCCIAVFLVGCHQAHVAAPLPKELSSNDPDSQINFWHQMADEPITSNDAAFHGLLLYMDNKDDSADYAGRVAELKSRHMLPGGFNQPAEAAIQKGTLAMALCKALNIKGGATMQVLNAAHIDAPMPRYAVLELEFLNMYPPNSSPNQTFSGNEYVGIIGRVEDYQRGDMANKPAADLPNDVPAK